MKTQVWVYIVVAVLSLGAGVAIAGVPRTVDRAPTIQPPVSTTTTTSTTTPTTAPSSDSSPADDDATGDANDDAEPVATDAPAETTTTSTTSTPSTTSTTTSTTVAPAERDTLEVAVVNGAEVGGAASSVAAALEEVGYLDVGSYDGTEIRDLTVVYAAEGLQSEAERLSQEIGIDSGLIFPIDTAPTVASLAEGVQILVYLGRNVIDLTFFN